MRNLRWLIAAVLPLVALSFAVEPASAVVIDDFTTFQSPPGSSTNVINATLANGYTNLFTNSMGSYTETIGGANPLGGSRSVSASGVTVPGVANTNLNSTLGILSFDTGAIGEGNFDLTYDGAGISALGSDQIIDIAFESVDPPGTDTTVDVTVTVTGTSGSESVTETVSELVFGSGPVTYGFDFGASLTSLVGTVTAIEVSFPLVGGAAGDVAISQISSSSTPVPEPASLAVWGMLGGIGLVVRRRRRRNQRA